MPRPRRHHYLPAFLLSQFQIPRGRRSVRVRALRADGVFEASVRDIGVEKDFHDQRALFRDPEGVLSGWEGKFASEINRWTTGELDKRGSATADCLIPHLRFRSRTMRRLGDQVMQSLLDATGRGLAGAVVASEPQRHLRARLGELLDQVAREARAGTWTERARQEMLDNSVKQAIADSLSHWSVIEASRLTKDVLGSGFVRQTMIGAHTTIILTTLINHRRFDAFGDWHWEVVAVGGEPLLLGDVGSLCWYEGSKLPKPLYACDTPLLGVCLPLGPERLLVGWHDAQPQLPDPALLNRATIELSHEFVVGTWSPQQLEPRRSQLAARASEDTPEEILGIEISADAPLILEAAQALGDAVRNGVDRHWGGSERDCGSF